MTGKVIVHCKRICLNNINGLCNTDEITIIDDKHFPCDKYVLDKERQHIIWGEQDAKRRNSNK